MRVLCVSGDGCSYGEGGNHFLAAVRRNLDITLLVHDNQIYGLTKGQAQPDLRPGARDQDPAHGRQVRAVQPPLPWPWP